MLTVIDRFSDVCRRHANCLALISDEESLTYKELSIRVEQFASLIDHRFRQVVGRNAGHGDVIAIALDKSVNLYASILAILSVGASYVPLDPALSKDLQAYILDTCQCRLVLTDQVLPADVKGIGTMNLGSAAVLADLHACTYSRSSHASETDGCYSIFTSGSTGRPKGVQITHRNLLNLVDWVHAEFSLNTTNRVLQYSTINFDASVLDIFPTLLAGSALCIPSGKQRLSEVLLGDFCARHQVDHAFLPPALLNAIDATRFPTLKSILTGGEACSPSAIAAWCCGRRFYNLYGPTECTVLVTFKPMRVETSRTNIGQAISGVRLYVLDEEMHPAQRGELHVAGLAVSSGYVGDQITTDRKFVKCPEIDDGVMYKTGDIVEQDQAGDLHFVGRVDRQVKIRGYRIELEEIEGALVKLGCAEAALKVSSLGDLVAYVALKSGQTTVELRNRLTHVLSDYKIPQFFVDMGHLPKKPSGKVDYEALPELQPSRAEVAFAKVQEGSNGPYAAIFSVWAEVLNLPAEAMHAQSNFRDLGGSSIKIVRLLSNIENRFGTRIPFSDFLNNPTPGFLHTAIQRHENSTPS